MHDNALDLVTSLRVVAEVAAGMAYLHANNVVHRDLKSPNVLLDDALCARITDFGLSTFAHDHSKTVSKVAGTPHWASPEQLLEQKLYADTDVFSFGVIVWEVLFHCRPWHHGEFASDGATFVDIGIAYRAHRYLPVDDTINGRVLNDAQKKGAWRVL